MLLNINCALLDGNASVLRNILSGSDNMVFKSRKRKPRQKADNCTCENIFQCLCKTWELQSSNILSRLFHSCQRLGYTSVPVVEPVMFTIPFGQTKKKPTLIKTTLLLCTCHSTATRANCNLSSNRH